MLELILYFFSALIRLDLLRNYAQTDLSRVEIIYSV